MLMVAQHDEDSAELDTDRGGKDMELSVYIERVCEYEFPTNSFVLFKRICYLMV